MARRPAGPTVRSRSSVRSRSLALVSGLLLVLVTIGLVLLSGLSLPSSVAGLLGDSSSTATPTTRVASTTRQLYCPRSIGLADSGSYGDSSFSASEGDLASARTLLAFGSTYEGQVSGVRSDSSSEALSLPAGDKVGVSRSKADSAVIASSSQLSASAGDGLVGTTGSWASTGDVRGIASAGCTASLSQAHFLLPGTQVGHTAALEVANPSDKSTVIEVRLWGTSRSGEIHPAANSQVSLAAHASTSISLPALTGHQDAALVEARSTSVAVHMLVDTSAVQGLTPKGVEFADTITATKRGVLTGLSQGSAARLLLFSSSAAHVEGGWLTESGRADAKNLSAGADLTAGRVVSVDLGSIPETVHALWFSSDAPVYAQIVQTVQTVSGKGGQQDYSLIRPETGRRISAFALPEGLSADVVVANDSQTPVRVLLRAVSSDGSLSEGRTVRIPAHSSISTGASTLGGSSLAGVVATTLDAVRGEAEKAGTSSGASSASSASTGSGIAQVTAAAVLTSPALTRASVAQSAVLPFSSLMPSNSTVEAVRSPLAAVGSGEDSD